MTRRFKLTIPFVILFLLLGLLWQELSSASTRSRISSSMIGEPVPYFSLPSLFSSNKSLTSTRLRGRVSLLNVWASWCSACNMEHSMLMRIKNEYHVPIYGILYRDNADDAISWLQKKGNPYANIGDDKHGNTAVDLGIYGTPETFVISPSGKIIYRHIGVITQSIWDDSIYPLIKQYEH